MNSDRTTAEVKKANGKHVGKVAPSTKPHEVYRKGYGVVHVGSRTACNRYWVALPSEVRASHVVQVITEGRW